MDFLECIGENRSTVKEVLEVFKKSPVSIPKNFFIADKKKGEMVVLEHNVSEYKVVSKDNILIHSNHYLDPDLAKKDQVLIKFPYHNTFIRYYEALQK